MTLCQMFNGSPGLAVVVVCALYSLGLGSVVGDADTVPQEGPGCPCCSIANEIDGVNVGNICEFTILEELYVEATHYCSGYPAIMNKLNTLRALAAMRCVNSNKL